VRSWSGRDTTQEVIEVKRSEENTYREYVTARMETMRRTAYLLCRDSGKIGGAPTASQPPLTLDQLVTIGVDPALTMFPG
jgi:hypothetical protein